MTKKSHQLKRRNYTNRKPLIRWSISFSKPLRDKLYETLPNAKQLSTAKKLANSCPVAERNSHVCNLLSNVAHGKQLRMLGMPGVKGGGRVVAGGGGGGRGRSGESTCLPSMWPGFDSASYVGWVCLFSSLQREVFPRVLRFSFSSKPNIWFDLRWLLISVYGVPN